VTSDPWHRITTASSIDDLVNEIESRQNEKNRREAQAIWLGALQTWFVEKGNPLCVWAAVKYCSDRKLPLPDWVLVDLGLIAHDLLEVANTTLPRDAPKAALKALGLSAPKGQGSPFEEFQRATKREPFCISFGRKILFEKSPYGQTKLDVAKEFSVSPELVDVWLRSFFPDKRGTSETWLEFFQRKTNLEGSDYDKLLASLLYL